MRCRLITDKILQDLKDIGAINDINIECDRKKLNDLEKEEIEELVAMMDDAIVLKKLRKQLNNK